MPAAAHRLKTLDGVMRQGRAGATGHRLEIGATMGRVRGLIRLSNINDATDSPQRRRGRRGPQSGLLCHAARALRQSGFSYAPVLLTAGGRLAGRAVAGRDSGESVCENGFTHQRTARGRRGARGRRFGQCYYITYCAKVKEVFGITS